MKNMQTEIINILHVQLLKVNSFARKMTNFAFTTGNIFLRFP